jgi:transcriptional regulator with XRE-family HTH domain
MSKTLDQKLNELGPTRRKRVDARADELIAEEISLRELRRAHRLTQKRVAEKLGIGQEGVSRLEQRSDLLISTLRSYVEAMGGSLSIVAKFPDCRPVFLAGLTGIEPQPARSRKPHPRL